MSVMHFDIDDAPGFSLLGDWEANPPTVRGACGYIETKKTTKDLEKMTCKNCRRSLKFRRLAERKR
jgi:hypothetical protein